MASGSDGMTFDTTFNEYQQAFAPTQDEINLTNALQKSDSSTETAMINWIK